MDLQVITPSHPDAKLVLVNARPSVEGRRRFREDGPASRVGGPRFSGAIWSFSIGWGCDRLFTAADLVPVRTALAAALERGTTAFDATGDLAGLECKGGHDWADRPSPDDVGVDAVASMPEMTAVGGTRLSTTSDGDWLDEQSWYDVPSPRGTAGGASRLYPRPPWQTVDPGAGPEGSRLIPDVSAVGDPFTGVKDRLQATGPGRWRYLSVGPIWAGMSALINEKFADIGAAPLGELNPDLYRVAGRTAVQSFRDVRVGGNQWPRWPCRLRHGHRSGHAQHRQPGERHPARAIGALMQAVTNFARRLRPTGGPVYYITLGLWVVGLVVAMMLLTFVDTRVVQLPLYACPPDCGSPPTALPVATLPRYEAMNGAFSVAYPAPGAAYSVTKDDNG